MKKYLKKTTAVYLDTVYHTFKMTSVAVAIILQKIFMNM